ncbi:hypothetical protein Ancab_039197 [Ancistrocladus abbreviatus]
MEGLEPPPETQDRLKLCNQLLTTLLDEHLPLIHNFRGKWSLIRIKLTDLRTHLHDLSDLLNHLSNSLPSDVLSSIGNTLADAVSLSDKCRSPNLNEGKLKTQSDIDSVIAKLDHHINDCVILLRSGVLQDAADAASNDPPSSAASGTVAAKREAVRVKVRSLLTRLQIGASESKSSAMDSILALLHEDDKNVLIAVAQGIVPIVVRLLDSSLLEMKEKAVAAISRVSTVDSGRHVLIAEGLLFLNHLIRVLESGSGLSKEKACVALQALSFSRENARAIGSRGGISSLLEICDAGTPSSQAVAAGVLRNLAQFDEIKENFIEENAICVLISLSSSGTALGQENAIGCLSNLVRNEESLKVLVAREDGIESLKNYWDSTPVGPGIEPAVELLKNLASYQPIGEVLVLGGFISKLAGVLSCGVLGVRIAAAGAVYELGFSSKSRKEVGECGCISPLTKMLDGKAIEEIEAATRALSRLLLCDFNRRIFRKEERGIVCTVLLLDPLTQNLDKKWPISVLASLVCSKKCRKQMIAGGACLYLQKLAELDVEGAKKLLDSLDCVPSSQNIGFHHLF